MPTDRRLLFLFLAFSLVVISRTASAQHQIDTIPVGNGPYNVALNAVTNKIYVSNFLDSTVTVIDGKTDSATTLTVGTQPYGLAVNPVTNKIYVANENSSSVTVIDGATDSTITVSVSSGARYLAVNPVTDKIYVAPYGGDIVTVIDGATNSTLTVPVGTGTGPMTVNTVTNKIYVINYVNQGRVTVIDGATNFTTNVPVGTNPNAIAVNAITNKIYVANGNNGTGTTVTVIDGATNLTTPVTVGTGPGSVGVDPVTNEIYVAYFPTGGGSGGVTVIDGVTLSTTNVSLDGGVGYVGVDPATNKIYVTTSFGVVMIDGATLSTTLAGEGNIALAINGVTNRIYATFEYPTSVSVIVGADANALQFVPVPPCRLIDTRQMGGPIQGGTSRIFDLPQLAQSASPPCESLSSAAAFSLNVSVVPSGQLGYLSLWPTGEDQPLVATLNSIDGRIKADAAIVPAGYQGAVSIYVTNTTNVILDINGYFAPVSGSTLAFYPLTPCRVADTRNSSFPQGLGPPFLSGHTERQFPILNATTCNIPSSAEAYSLNFSVVPHGGLGYLTVWPTGESRPLVSTLNDVPGTIIANAAIVPAGTGSDVSVYPSNDTDLIIDINGYFAPAGPGGLSLYPSAPCRVIDTRHVGSGQPFSGNLTPPVDVVDSQCEPPAAAQAYVFNATVVPTGGLGYLTLWPDGEPKPLVSTLNALDGSITNNMAIVPSTNGKVDAFASGITQLILDISSYFAP